MGRTLATCWCERKFVRVTTDDVRAGRTGSCGPGCHEGCASGSTEETPVRVAAVEFGDCPVCGVADSEPCVTRSGHQAYRAHAARYDPDAVVRHHYRAAETIHGQALRG